jgi:hypothetical protein
MARLGRLERPTSCFGGTRSIQLSYSRVPPLYHAALQTRICRACFQGKEPAKRRFAVLRSNLRNLLDSVGDDGAALHLHVD